MPNPFLVVTNIIKDSLNQKDNNVSKESGQQELKRKLDNVSKLKTENDSNGSSNVQADEKLLVMGRASSKKAKLLQRGSSSETSIPSSRCSSDITESSKLLDKEQNEESCSKSKRCLLPTKAVAILRQWILSPEHIMYPYPTAEEKKILIEKTGISHKQLKYWFVNARRRIWKQNALEKIQEKVQEKIQAKIENEKNAKSLQNHRLIQKFSQPPVTFGGINTTDNVFSRADLVLQQLTQAQYSRLTHMNARRIASLDVPTLITAYNHLNFNKVSANELLVKYPQSQSSHPFYAFNP